MFAQGCVCLDPAPSSTPPIPKLERLTPPFSSLSASSFFSAYSAALRVLCVKAFFRLQLSASNLEPLPFPSSHFLFSIFCLSPMVPLDTKYSLVTRFFPLLTQKQGGGPPVKNVGARRFFVFPAFFRTLLEFGGATTAFVVFAPLLTDQWRKGLPRKGESFALALQVARLRRRPQQRTGWASPSPTKEEATG